MFVKLFGESAQKPMSFSWNLVESNEFVFSNPTRLHFVHSSGAFRATEVKNVIKFIVSFSVFGSRKASGRVVTSGNCFLLDICPVRHMATVEVANTRWQLIGTCVYACSE